MPDLHAYYYNNNTIVVSVMNISYCCGDFSLEIFSARHIRNYYFIVFFYKI